MSYCFEKEWMTSIYVFIRAFSNTADGVWRIGEEINGCFSTSVKIPFNEKQRCTFQHSSRVSGQEKVLQKGNYVHVAFIDNPTITHRDNLPFNHAVSFIGYFIFKP